MPADIFNTDTTDDTGYPACEKLAEVAPKSQAIGEFIDWLEDTHGIVLATRDQETDELYEISKRPRLEPLLAEYFGVDMTQVEMERRQMIESLRAQHG